MLTAQFSRPALESVFEPSDRVHYPFTRVAHQRTHYLETISERINGGAFGFCPLIEKSIRGFKAYRTQKLGDELVLRRLAEILRAAYHVRQPDRAAIVGQIKTLLAEPVPKGILRLDIESFFESVDRAECLKKLTKDRVVSHYAIALIGKFFDVLPTSRVRGLPRGLSISAALSEVCLLETDGFIRRTPGVYYYARYVDDMVAFTTLDPIELKKEVAEALPSPIKLNDVKSQVFRVGCRCAITCAHPASQCPCRVKCKCKTDDTSLHILNYVGYVLRFPDVAGTDDRDVLVKVGMASDKVNRIKTRVVLAFLDHVRRANFHLLEQRLLFLSGNQHMPTRERKGNLRSGIFYNYSQMTEYSVLEDIDKFLRSILHARKSTFARRVQLALNPGELTRLKRLSFVSGYHSKRSRRVTSGLMAAIRRCWKYV